MVFIEWAIAKRIPQPSKPINQGYLLSSFTKLKALNQLKK